MGRHGVRARGADSGGLTWACRFFPGRADKPGPPGSAARWPRSEGTALAAQQWFLLESRLHPGMSLCSHPGLVLSSCELQSHENHFCVTLFVGEGRARSACAVPAQSRHGQRASAPAPQHRSGGLWQDRLLLCSPGRAVASEGGRVCPGVLPCFSGSLFHACCAF